MGDQTKERKGEIKYLITLNEEQKECKRLILDNEIVIITGRAGCLGIGTKVLMYDGTFKVVEDVVVGDQLMGVDSTPRNVLSLNRGVDQMYWVRQKKGDGYRVNESHILSFKKVNPAVQKRKTVGGIRTRDRDGGTVKDKSVTTVNMDVLSYLKLGTGNIKKHKGYIAPCIEFKKQDLLIDPYYFGLWLGDGNRRDIKQITNTDPEIIEYLNSLGCDVFTKKHDNIAYYFKEDCIKLNSKFNSIFNLKNISSLLEKYIPDSYLYNSKENRLQLLAGLIDSDGHYILHGKCYEITQKNKLISEQIAYLSRSLGYKTNIRTKKATMKKEDGSMYSCEVYRITFMPNEIIPVKISRKRNQIGSDFKDRSHTGITIEKDIVDNYYGFTLDGDNLFILEDFTVTHNCGKSLVAAQTTLDLVFKREVDKAFITRPTQQMGESLGFLPGTAADKLNPYLDPFKENLYQCYDKTKVEKIFEEERIEGFHLQFARGKTIGSKRILIIDEAQNCSKHQMLGLLTRLGKGGRIVVIGDNEQKDIRDEYNGLSYAIELSKKISEIKWVKLHENHRADVVGKILELEYNK